MNKIRLGNLQLKTFTEQDAEDYCLLNNINPDNIIKLYLNFNKLTDISGIKLFKNTKELWLYENKLTDISVLKDLKKLKGLYLYDNELTDISVLKYVKDLKYLSLNRNKLTDISVIQYLNSLEVLSINELKLESDQIKYMNSCKNLKTLYCREGFKDMSVLNQLNNNIKVIK